MFPNMPPNPMPPSMPPTFPPHMMMQGAPMMAGAAPKAGLLSRLFGKGAGAVGGQMAPGMSQAIPGAIGAANPSSALSAATGAASSGGSNLLTWLNHTQRFIGVAQQVGPMVQQYGPLIRSAPALYRMFRSNSSSDESTTDNAKKAESTTEVSSDVPTAKISPSSKTKRNNHRGNSAKTVNGIPAPKLYI